MEINITTVTANKLWSAARLRVYPKIKRVKDAVESLKLSDDFCDILQIIFQDPDTAKRVGNDGFVSIRGQKKKDGIVQVSMITPSGLSFDENEDSLLFEATMERVISAIKRTQLKEANKEKIIEEIKKALGAETS